MATDAMREGDIVWVKRLGGDRGWQKARLHKRDAWSANSWVVWWFDDRHLSGLPYHESCMVTSEQYARMLLVQ